MIVGGFVVLCMVWGWVSFLREWIKAARLTQCPTCADLHAGKGACGPCRAMLGKRVG